MLINGKAFYARILGNPHTTEYNTEGEWSFDLSVNEETAQKLLEAGMRKTFLKTHPEKGTFVSFKRNAVKSDGTAGKPFVVLDNQNEPWPQDKLIGNGSELNVIVVMSERTDSKKKEKYLRPSAIKVQVWNHIPFVGKQSDFKVKEGVEVTEDVTNTNEW